MCDTLTLRERVRGLPASDGDQDCIINTISTTMPAIITSVIVEEEMTEGLVTHVDVLGCVCHGVPAPGRINKSWRSYHITYINYLRNDVLV